LRRQTSSSSYPTSWTDTLTTTPFFALQPFGLAVEAFVKRLWRIQKRSALKGGKEPAWLVSLERTIGFVWTCWWLGSTAQFYVQALTMAGLYLPKEGQTEKWSLAGGMIYGKWVF
jgi:hypothetical protein